ncbi:TIGR02270 family protein [Pyxidicoccus parkwayensis]|uniref:TIGR02270 family protein n=1 Tax=Pyxidicoccus parkwayensis TaxID=2813578 RepID=A0ABX7NKX2_9BACT|nr:TIGR02270 family protein [Pyxidicoccus parkwaysis]QSQ19029.1 TIGR02270 family protein [Pyxidicoccus parkwaysis]
MRWDILERHLSEAAFLWTQWERVLHAPHYTLEDVAELEERLRAHLDGLVLGGPPVADRLLWPAMEEAEPGLAQAAALCLLHEELDPHLDCVEHWLPTEQVSLPEPLRRILEVVERPGLPERLHLGLDARPLPIRAELARLLGLRRVRLGEFLEGLLTSSDEDARVAALQAIESAPDPAFASGVQRSLNTASTKVRDAAITTGLVLGLHAAWDQCLRQVRSHAPEGARCRLLLALCGSADSTLLLREALEKPELRRDTLWAVGFSGRPALAEACLPLLRSEACAALAGEAFCAITGLVLEGRFRAGPPPEPEEPLPLEEDLATSVELTAESELPLPAADAVEAWWASARKNFDFQARYLRGQRLTPTSLLDALEHGPMRRRPVQSLELAIRSQGELSVQVSGFTRMQRRQLQAARQCRLTASKLFAAMG